ncbi:MAG: hypothetical protein WBG71_16145 [Leeuwenhoekiella sp.]
MEQQSKWSYDNISLSQFQNRINDKDYLETLFKRSKSKTSKKSLHKNSLDAAYILTHEIAAIEKDSLFYYTFPIKAPRAQGKFYNFVLTATKEGDVIDDKVIEYTASPEWRADIKLPFSGYIREIQDHPFSTNDIFQLRRTANLGMCVEGATGKWRCNYGKEHAPGEGRDCDEWTYIISVTFGPCPAEDAEDPEPYPGDNGDTGGGGGSAGGPGVGTTPIVPCEDGEAQEVDENGNCYGDPIDEEPTISPEESNAIAINQLLEDNPYLLLDIDCDQLPNWVALAQHTPPQSVLDKIEQIDEDNITLFGDFDVQYIDDAEGAVVNMDYFPVVIDRLPTNPITGQRFTADGFLEYIRLNINDFVDTDFSSFSPENEVDTGYDESAIWFSSYPLGAILHIEIPFNDGSVVCSEIENDNWIFSTIEAPWDFAHPVSGNRQIGYEINTDGSYTFFSRGVDRFESQMDYEVADYMFIGQPLNGADSLWISFQQKLQAFCNKPLNDGVANASPRSINRPNWEDVMNVLKGNRPVSDLGCD